MNIYKDVTDCVLTIDAARRYGFQVNRNSMICCPFHNDKNPSMKVDKRFHCFGCGEDGNVINFVEKLFGLTPLEAAKKLAHDFGIPCDEMEMEQHISKPAKPNLNHQYLEGEQLFFLTLVRYRNLLKSWKKDYAPKRITDDWDKRFCEALKELSYVQYLIDSFLESSDEERIDMIIENKGAIVKYEEKLRRTFAG